MSRRQKGWTSFWVIAAWLPLAFVVHLRMQDFGSGLPQLDALGVFALPPEDLAPDADATNPTDVFNNACATACSTADCRLDIDEDPDAAEDELEVSSKTDNATIRFDFPTPSGDPSTATDGQTFDLTMSRCDDDSSCTEGTGGNDPDFNLDVYCNGTLDVNMFSKSKVTGVDQAFSGTWTFDDVNCAADGSDLQAHFTFGESGGPAASHRWPCIENIEWEVTF